MATVYSLLTQNHEGVRNLYSANGFRELEFLRIAFVFFFLILFCDLENRWNCEEHEA